MANLKSTVINGDTTIKGIIYSHNSSGRSTIKNVSQTNVPNDIYFGANKVDHWSLSSRETSNPFFGLYNCQTKRWTYDISNSNDTLAYHYNVKLDGALAKPGSDPLVAINYNTVYSDLGDNGLNMIKLGTTDNYIGQAPASRSPNSLPGLAFHTSMTNTQSEFAWVTHNWTYRMTLNTNGLSLYSGSVNIGKQISNSNSGDVTWLTLTPYRHTGGPWYIRNVDTSADSHLQIKYGTNEIFRMKHNGIIETPAESIQYTATGSGTYNRAVMYIDSNGLTWEAPRATDSSTGTARHHYFKVRGGDLADVHMRSIIFNGTIGSTTGSYIIYDSGENTMYINGKGKVCLESGSSSGHPTVRLAGTDYTIVHTGNISSYAIQNSGASPNCGDGTTITQPSGEAAISIRTTTGASRDVGIFRLTQDNAYIANSSDNGYTFAVYDTDLTQNFNDSDTASFIVLSNGEGMKARGKRVVTCDSNGGNGVMTYSNGTLTIS